MNDLDFVPNCEEAPLPEQLIRKGRLWPPILILCILFTFGLLLFFLNPPEVVVTDSKMPCFSLKEGTLYFDQTKYAGGQELVIPKSIKGQRVTSLSDNCFANLKTVISVDIPEGITSIGSGAFRGCTALRGLKLPETLSSIGRESFSGCAALEAVCIPYSVTQIEGNAFSGCASLTYVFYSGPMSSWEALGVDFSDKTPYIYCHDGLFPLE